MQAGGDHVLAATLAPQHTGAAPIFPAAGTDHHVFAGNLDAALGHEPTPTAGFVLSEGKKAAPPWRRRQIVQGPLSVSLHAIEATAHQAETEQTGTEQRQARWLGNRGPRCAD